MEGKKQWLVKINKLQMRIDKKNKIHKNKNMDDSIAPIGH